MRIEKERLDYLDIAKAITIFLVLMGHTGASTAMFLYRRIIYTFHMPLFLLISGIVSERRTDGSGASWRTFLRKNAYALLIPYFFWGILYTKFSYQSVLQVAYASWQTITASGTVLALWYLVCLFVARVEMEGVLALSGRFSMDSHLFALLVEVFEAARLFASVNGLQTAEDVCLLFVALAFLGLILSARGDVIFLPLICRCLPSLCNFPPALPPQKNYL